MASMLPPPDSGANRERRKKVVRVLMSLVAVFIGIVSVCFWCVFFLPACFEPIRYDGPYRGRVLDAETGKPIERAVVAVIWKKQEVLYERFGDAQEVLTDAEGKFSLPGQGYMILSNFRLPASIYIVKAGYKHRLMQRDWKSGPTYRLNRLLPGEKTLDKRNYLAPSAKAKLIRLNYEIRKNKQTAEELRKK